MNSYEATRRATPDVEIRYSSGYIAGIEGRYVEPPPIKNFARYRPGYGDQVVQGYACMYGKPLVHDQKIKIVTPGTFADSVKSNHRVRVLLSHDHHRCVGSTDNDDLELLADNFGIAFRFKIPNSDLGMEMQSLISSNQMDGMSIGFDSCQTETKIIDGTPVLFLSHGTLHEISLVPKGACKTAYAMLVDADTCGALRDDCLQFPMRLLSDGAYVDAMRFLRKLHDAL